MQRPQSPHRPLLIPLPLTLNHLPRALPSSHPRLLSSPSLTEVARSLWAGLLLFPLSMSVRSSTHQTNQLGRWPLLPPSLPLLPFQSLSASGLTPSRTISGTASSLPFRHKVWASCSVEPLQLNSSASSSPCWTRTFLGPHRLPTPVDISQGREEGRGPAHFALAQVPASIRSQRDVSLRTRTRRCVPTSASSLISPSAVRRVVASFDESEQVAELKMAYAL